MALGRNDQVFGSTVEAKHYSLLRSKTPSLPQKTVLIEYTRDQENIIHESKSATARATEANDSKSEMGSK